MAEEAILGAATEDDVTGIVAVLLANRENLFLRSKSDLRRNLGDFVVAKEPQGRILGCAALHKNSAMLTELLSVAVLPEYQGKGIGTRLMEECTQRAPARGVERLWLATLTPGYFARFGFQPISRWTLPTSVLLSKLRQVFQQPVNAWLPALFGRFVFMERRLGQE